MSSIRVCSRTIARNVVYLSPSRIVVHPQLRAAKLPLSSDFRRRSKILERFGGACRVRLLCFQTVQTSFYSELRSLESSVNRREPLALRRIISFSVVLQLAASRQQHSTILQSDVMPPDRTTSQLFSAVAANPGARALSSHGPQHLPSLERGKGV
jgi:hypothetical protein